MFPCQWKLKHFHIHTLVYEIQFFHVFIRILNISFFSLHWSVTSGVYVFENRKPFLSIFTYSDSTDHLHIHRRHWSFSHTHTPLIIFTHTHSTDQWKEKKEILHNTHWMRKWDWMRKSHFTSFDFSQSCLKYAIFHWYTAHSLLLYLFLGVSFKVPYVSLHLFQLTNVIFIHRFNHL